MSSLEQRIVDVTPGGHTAKVLLHRYGLGTLFAANVLGAGSVYILAQTGASVGFGLLWVLPLAFGLDMVMHDMSSRMAVKDQPLMSYIRRMIGGRAAVVYAVIMALTMQLWAVANYAVAGATLAWFTGMNVYACIGLMSAIGIALVTSQTYNVVEAAISGLLMVVFVTYAALSFGLSPDVTSVAAGLNPLSGVSDLTLIIAILGTTVYYPNFFIQSSMQPTKEWVDLDKYRRDNAAGISFSILISAGMLIVAAMALSPGELSLTEPAKPLVDAVGGWTLPVFMIAVLCASFTSATGTLFGSSFAVPQATGRKTVFGDIWFTVTTVVLIAFSAGVAMFALEFTNMTPVRMAITMPALNGAIFLPLTILAMYDATKHEMKLWQKAVSFLAVIAMFAGSVLTAQSLYDTVIAWI